MAAAPPVSFLVQRQIKGVWRDVQHVSNDHDAAQLARALVGLSPLDGVRILLKIAGDQEPEQEKVVWEYEGRRLLPRPDGKPAAPAATDRDAAPGGSGSVVRLDGVFRQPVLPDTRAQTRTNRKYLTIASFAVAFIVIALLATGGGQRGTGDSSGVAPERKAPRSDAAERPVEPTKDRVSYVQSFVARRYAYMSCVAENLGAGLIVARDAFAAGRIPGDLLRLYEDQFREVFQELHQGRRQLAVQPADKGGLPTALMDFIDQWFKLNREILWRTRTLEDIVNPETFCKKEAEEGNYLEAWNAQQSRNRQ